MPNMRGYSQPRSHKTAMHFEMVLLGCPLGWKLVQTCGLYHCGVMAAQTWQYNQNLGNHLTSSFYS